MLQSLQITNFKGFANLAIDKIGHLTIIGGKNNCGKSSLMEAMYMLFDRMNPHIVIRQSIARGIDAIPAEPTFMWAPIFNDFDIGKKIVIAAKFSDRDKKLELEVVENFEKPISIKSSIDAEKKSSPTGGNAALALQFSDGNTTAEKSTISVDQNDLGLFVEFSTGSRVPTAFFSARQPSNQNEDSERLGRLEIDNRTEPVLQVLRGIVPEIRSISSIRIANASIIYADIGKEKRVPIPYMGDGVARLLSIVLGVASCRHGVVFIDEIENGLHYSVMGDIWRGIVRAAQVFDCQIIASTHSHEFLSAACAALKIDSANAPDFSYIRLGKQGDEISGKIFDYDLLDYAIQSELEIR
ncbi:MAG TPA: AAA family ATPase [Rhodocyclaceae bacterium]|nr:AAA family ATPase [Rhodocyclaceae bacterium]